MTTPIFIDESGWTGDNLISSEQPVFVVASHQIPEAECRLLIDTYFSHIKANEIKHSDIRKRKRSQQGMLDLVKEIKHSKLPIATYIVHKRFALLQRFFDYLVEPVMHVHGLRPYDKAFNIRATSAAFVGLPIILGDRFMDDLLALFEKVARERSRAHLAEMWKVLQDARTLKPGPHNQMLDLLLVAKPYGLHHLDMLPDNALDVAFSVVVALMAHWRQLSDGPFELIHDETTALAKYHSLWEWLSSPEQQTATLGFGDYRDMILPLNVSRTIFARSCDYAGLQLADLLAGATKEIGLFILGRSSEEGYAAALFDVGLNEITNNIWPDANWEPPIHSRVGQTIDPLVFLGGFSRTRRS